MLKEQTFEAIPKCYKAPYGWGYEWVEKGFCDAYNIGQNVGTEAGLTIPFHIHSIHCSTWVTWKIQKVECDM